MRRENQTMVATVAAISNHSLQAVCVASATTKTTEKKTSISVDDTPIRSDTVD